MPPGVDGFIYDELRNMKLHLSALRFFAAAVTHLRVYLVVCSGALLLQGCRRLPLTQETKHPSQFLTCKTKVIIKNDTIAFAELTIKNRARKTSYKNMDVMLQLLNAQGDSVCLMCRQLNSPALKPRRKQKLLLQLYCPGQKPAKALLHNLYGTPVKKKKRLSEPRQTTGPKGSVASCSYEDARRAGFKNEV